MVEVSDDVFRSLVEEAVRSIPERFSDHLENVAFMTAPTATMEQIARGEELHGDETLLGLYEGIPLPERSEGYSGVVPDVITIFKEPHETWAPDLKALRQDVHQTVWHEVAHYFGLDHGQIEALEHK